MPAAKLGIDCKLYRNSATYESPTWAEIKLVRDLTLNQERAEGDVSVRGEGYKLTLSGMIEAGLEFDIRWDPTDTQFQALLDAFNNRTAVELAAMDGAIATAGSEGLRASFCVTGFSRNETMEDGVTASVTCKPTPSANAPAWHVIAA